MLVIEGESIERENAYPLSEKRDGDNDDCVQRQSPQSFKIVHASVGWSAPITGAWIPRVQYFNQFGTCGKIIQVTIDEDHRIIDAE